MLKTNNFQIHSRLAGFCLAILVSAVCCQCLVAKQAGTKPAKTDSSPSQQSKIPSKTSQAVIDDTLTDDAAVDKMLEPYSPKVRALDVAIGKLDGELKKGG